MRSLINVIIFLVLYNPKSELKSAITAGKNNKILEWTIAFLQKEIRNKKLVEDIQERNVIKTEIIEYPLSVLTRVSGLQNDETVTESLTKWVKRVEEIELEISNKHLPPPIIATDFWQELEIADGSHRHEALLKQGFTKYWTIFLFIDPKSAKKMHKKK